MTGKGRDEGGLLLARAPGGAASGRATLRAVYVLLRPSDSGIAFAGTLIGASLVGRPVLEAGTLTMALANLLLVAGSAAANDWRDVVEDRVNKPHSPVASGRVDGRTALALGCGLLATAILAASLVDPRLGLVAAFFVVSSLAYTLKLKGLPFLGNALVAVLSSESLWCWLVLGRPERFSPYALLCVACVAFCLGRELFGTARDLAGDRRRGVRTSATVLGAAGANRLGLAWVGVAGALACLPVFLGQATALYAVLLALCFGLAGRLAWRVLRSRADQSGRFAGRLVWNARWITVLMALGAAFGIAGP